MGKPHYLWFLFVLFCNNVQSQYLSDTYIQEWKHFYPSKAERAGMHDAMFYFEQREMEPIQKWLTYNQQILELLSQDNSQIDPVDSRLLKVQAQSEVDTYGALAVHEHSLRYYSQLILNAISSILKADYLIEPERSRLLCKRLSSISGLAKAAISNLSTVPKGDLESGLEDLSKTLDDLKSDAGKLPLDFSFSQCPALAMTTKSLETLVSFAIKLSVNAEEAQPILGTKEYERQLQLYTDSDMTSQELADLALTEIEVVKRLMVKVSSDYLNTTYPDTPLPNDTIDIINLALTDMEKDAPLNSTDYLEFWQQLADNAIDFIVENDIVTLPKTNTLRIQTAPESAGPAARIGWVASAPPFAPNPMTTLNLPSIPETLPKQEQIDFWASFNKPFNRMIVIHELYPGHYTQLKISRETAHPIRLLFPYGVYIEGWATLPERVILDEGWEKGNHLTFLAHLRKRLENANRSYTSVQVHCNGWNEEQVMKFSIETALLAPQFAKSLWGRIMRSPMQLTSYFLGGAAFTKLLQSEKQRLGDKFNLKLFMDSIIKAGPIPIDEFYSIFEQMQPTEQ
ncbi:MAG: DUF885 family protein [Croceivirga sp.]